MLADCQMFQMSPVNTPSFLLTACIIYEILAIESTTWHQKLFCSMEMNQIKTQVKKRGYLNIVFISTFVQAATCIFWCAWNSERVPVLLQWILCKVISWCFSQLKYSARGSAWEPDGSWESIWLEGQSCLPFPKWIMDSNLCWHKAWEMKQQTLCENEGNMSFVLTKTLSSPFLTVPFYSFSKCCLVSIGPRARENRHSDYSWRPFWNINFIFLFVFLPDLTRKIHYINPILFILSSPWKWLKSEDRREKFSVIFGLSILLCLPKPPHKRRL